MFSESMRFNQLIGANVNRKRSNSDKLNLSGRFYNVEHYREGLLLAKYDFLNGITNEGKNFLWDVMFNGATQIANNSWFIFLIDSASFTALNAADTMASHSTWIEFTGYSQSTRVAWGSGSASSQTVTNATPATFDITSSGTLKGIGICSNGTKSGTSGKLWTTGTFSADVPVANQDQLKISYAAAA